MAMVFCRGCGKELHDTAPTCPHCGAPQGVSASAATPPNAPTPQAVPESWAKKFALIEKAGGPKLPRAKELSFGERLKVVFNLWAFLFGPVYYLVKGMWKKAITLLAVSLAIIIAVDFLLGASDVADLVTGLTASVVFGTRGTIDFYKKVVLAENGWW